MPRFGLAGGIHVVHSVPSEFLSKTIAEMQSLTNFKGENFSNFNNPLVFDFQKNNFKKIENFENADFRDVFRKIALFLIFSKFFKISKFSKFSISKFRNFRANIFFKIIFGKSKIMEF